MNSHSDRQASSYKLPVISNRFAIFALKNLERPWLVEELKLNSQSDKTMVGNEHMKASPSVFTSHPPHRDSQR